MNISIADEIFEKFPGYRRGLVIAYGIENRPSPDGLIERLRAAENRLCTELSPENFINHPKIAVWREAYRSLGIKPGDFRPSMDALVRRVLKKDPLPAINRIVDIGNLVSIQNIVPIGAHAIDLITQDLQLRPAAGDESFEPFGSDTLEHPAPAEIIFAEGHTVLTRRWTWRQAKHTLVLDSTTAVEINVDALPPVSDDEVSDICEQLASLVSQYCGGKLRIEVLSPQNPSIAL
jgi:DNA/RNA-binding domain of Phe-tRNA-synthetase-like protein